MSMPIYRVMAQKREDKEKEEMEKKEKEEASIQLDNKYNCSCSNLRNIM